MTALRSVFSTTRFRGRHCLSPDDARRRWRKAEWEQASTYCTYRKSDFSCTVTASGRCLSGLPVTVTLPHSQESVVVENLGRNGIEEAFQLVESAAKTGNNVGVDEFPALKDLVDRVGQAFAVAIRSVRTGTLDAFILFGPCLSARTIRPRLASFQVVTSDRFARDAIWRDSAELAVDLVRQLPDGYSACVTEVFAACVNRIVALRKQGFAICACVPLAGSLRREQRVSYSPSYLMYREISPANDTRPPLTNPNHLPPKVTCSSIDVDTDDVADEWSLTTEYPSIPGLPFHQFLPSRSGISVLVRPLRPEESGRYYKHFLQAAEAEEGYSTDEFPTRGIFWEIFKRHENMVVEEASTGDWLAVMCLSQSLFGRGRSPVVCDGSLVVARKFRHCGVGTQLLQTLLRVAKHLGYRGVYSDTPVYDVPSLSACFSNRMVFSGTLPKAIYSARHGWSDVILLYKAFDDQ